MTQCERVLQYIREHGSITQAEAINAFGCYRLGARIYDLKSKGIDIRRTLMMDKNRWGDRIMYAKYWIHD